MFCEEVETDKICAASLCFSPAASLVPRFSEIRLKSTLYITGENIPGPRLHTNRINNIIH